MKHKLLHSIQVVDISEIRTSNLALVLSAQARSYGLRWLLAHADDGVIWGEFRPDGLHISSDAFPHISPSLRVETLQQMRVVWAFIGTPSMAGWLCLAGALDKG